MSQIFVRRYITGDANANDLTSTGVYMVNNLAGRPADAGTWLIVVVFAVNDDIMIQLLFDSRARLAFFRTLQGDPAAWSTWISL